MLQKVTFAFVILLCALARAEGPPTLEVKEGDNRIVFLGDGMVEQAQFSGYIETRLSRRFPDRHVICSNLGWSGDDVWGSARTAGFQNPARFERLKKETTALRPDIIVVGYGFSESYAGAEGLPHFVEGYSQLLAELGKLTPRLVLLSPTFGEDLGRPLPDQAEHNRDVEQYTAAIKAIAIQRHLPFVDLFHPLVEAKRANPTARLTHNGVHLNDAGYWIAAQEFEKQLGLRPEPAHLTLTAGGKVLAAQGVKVGTVDPAQQGLALQVTDGLLPAPPAPAAIAAAAGLQDPAAVLQVTDLAAGDWTLAIDGKPVMTASASQWNSGVNITAGPALDQVEKLRQTIEQRNELSYRRWRPFNDHPRHFTYIAGDYAMYDKEIAGVDERIAELARPVGHTYSISKK